MTVGNTTWDMRSDVTTGCGAAKVGFLSTKKWSGSDGKHRENPYTCTITASSSPLISWRFTYRPPFYTGTVDSCFGGLSVLDPTTTQKNDALQRALKGILGKYRQHDFSAAVFLGELPESVGMVLSPCLTTLKAFQAVRRGKFGHAVKILKDAHRTRNSAFRVDKKASSAWLSLRYGWMPLLADAHAAADAYRTFISGKVTATRLRSKNTFNVPQVEKTLKGPKWCKLHTQVVCITDMTMTTMQSLGFSNPALLAWEFLPGSFVLDWVYDVGSWLELLFDLPQSTATRYVITQVVHRHANGPVIQPSYIIQNSENYMEMEIKLTRTVQQNPPVPRPHIKNPFNGTLVRILDMMSLAVTLH